MTHATDENGWSEGLADLGVRGLRRRLREVAARQGAHLTVNGRSLVCFASNNYLALADHPAVVAAVREAVAQWGWGAGASRLVCGHMGPHAQFEQRLAVFKGTEAALVCPTGYHANLAAIRALAGKGDVVFLDKLNHASIIDAARGSGAVVRVFPHRDYRKLERLLAGATDARRRVIVTDSLFSMDGDLADLPRLVELKRAYAALLCVDEAHATGVLGPHGRGAAELLGVEAEIDVTVGTLSKALGGIGGFVAGPRSFIDWVVNTAGPFIYTTALPPAACAAALAALDLVEREPARREKLLALARQLRGELTARGWDIGPSVSQIVPVIVGDAERAVSLSAKLEAEGILAPAIRPPTVPRGQARLRLSLCADHDSADVDRLLVAMGQERERASKSCGTAL